MEIGAVTTRAAKFVRKVTEFSAKLRSSSGLNDFCNFADVDNRASILPQFPKSICNVRHVQIFAQSGSVQFKKIADYVLLQFLDF